MTQNQTTNDVMALANLIYGEAGGEGEDFMKMVGSSVMQRAYSGREFGNDIQTVINNDKSGYDAVQKNSPMYQEATSGKFRDEDSEKQWKKAFQIASGLVTGKIGFGNAQFYLTKEEIKNLQEDKTKFDFSLVHNIGKIKSKKGEEFQLFRYKDKTSLPTDSANV